MHRPCQCGCIGLRDFGKRGIGQLGCAFDGPREWIWLICEQLEYGSGGINFGYFNFGFVACCIDRTDSKHYLLCVGSFAVCIQYF